MKITIKRALSALLCVLMLLALYSCDAYSIGRIQKDYERIAARVEQAGDELGDRLDKYTLEYADIFDRISKGSEELRDEYAELLRKVTQYSVEFQDSEVFAVAKGYAELLRRYAAGETEFGVTDIAFSADGVEAIEIAYVGVTSYSVKNMESDEKYYWGGALTAFDDSFGAYKLELTFHDSVASKTFLEKYPPYTLRTLPDTGTDRTIRMMSAYNADHGFVIYIGSDKPLGIADSAKISLAVPIGIIAFPITE